MFAAAIEPRFQFSTFPHRLTSVAGPAVAGRTMSSALPTRFFRVAISPCGEMVAAGGEDGKAWLWEAASGRRHSYSLIPGATVRSVAFVGEGDALAFAGGNWLRREGVLKVWHLGRSDAKTLWTHNRPITALAASPDGKYLFAGSGDGVLRGWDLAGDVELPTIQAHDDEITSLAFSPDGYALATAGADRMVRIWSRKLEPRASLRGHERVVRDIAFAPAGRRLASIDEQAVLIWNLAEGRSGRLQSGDLPTGRIAQRLDAPSGFFRGVAFGKDSSSLWTIGASLPGQSETRSWDLDRPTGKIIRRHDSPLAALAVSPDRSRLAAADSQGRVHLWPIG